VFTAWLTALLLTSATGAAAAGPSAAGDDAPALLRRAIAQRTAWSKGAVDFTWGNPQWGGATRFYTAQFTPLESLAVWHGDAEGVLHRDAAGRPLGSLPFGPLYTLDTDDAQWQVQEGAVQAQMWRRSAPLRSLDIRSLGLTPGVPRADPAQAAEGLEKARLRGVVDGLQVVTLERDGGRLTWRLDPQRGGQPLRVTLEHGGRIVAESRVTLERFGDAWFPAQVEYFDGPCEGAKAPREVIRVSEARFDAPDLPDSIHLSDIGVDAGINVEVRTQGRAELEDACKWDGQRLITNEDFLARSLNGELRPGPIFERNWQRLRAANAGSQVRLPARRGQEGTGPQESTRATTTDDGARLKPIPDWESEWERYVREFCDKHRFDPGQRAEADRLLNACKKLGHEYVARRRFAFEAFDRAARSLAELEPAEQARRRPALEAQRLGLVLPLRELFEQRLKPGLEKLPTRAQRAAAAANAQPVPARGDASPPR
jgi:hypothetical protein